MKRHAILFGVLVLLTVLAWTASGQYITGGTKGPTGATGPTGPTGPTGAQGPGGVTSSCAGTTPNVLYVCQQDLTSSEIATLNSVPVQAIAAPSSGKMLRPIWLASQVSDGTIPFSVPGVSFGELDATFGGAGFPGVTGGLLTISSGAVNDFSYAPAINDGSVLRTSRENVALNWVGQGDDASGAINANSLGAGGTNYAVNDTFTVDGGHVSFLAAGVVDSIGGGGAVVTYHLTANGAGYLTGAGQATTATSGIGTGLTINVTSLTPANGTARVWITYMVLPLP